MEAWYGRSDAREVKSKIMASSPLHRTVFAAIQEKIFSGEWSEGSLMPTEAELCTFFEVSRITVRRALDDLARLGLVEKIQGKGTFVRRTLLRSGDANIGFLDAMSERGVRVTSRLLVNTAKIASGGIAARSRAGAGIFQDFVGSRSTRSHSDDAAGA